MGITYSDILVVSPRPWETSKAAALWGSHYAIRWQEQLCSPILHNIEFVFISCIRTLISHAREEDVQVSGDHWNSNNSGVCSCVNRRPLLAKSMKITLFVTHNMLQLHTPYQDTWAFFSTGASHITLNEQKSFCLPAVALVCHAECSVTVCTVNCLGTKS